VPTQPGDELFTSSRPLGASICGVCYTSFQTISGKTGAEMGGFGSGRRSGFGRGTVEACRSIDVNRLHREGCLQPGWWGGWQWTRDGEKVASIDMRAEERRLLLLYRYRSWGSDDWEEIEEPVSLEWTTCHFGGARPWFVCPGMVNGVACRRRVGKLYGAGRYFLCRHCDRLGYQSQREQRHDRVVRRVDKIRMRLGGDPGMWTPFPEKPKGMHWRSYDRLRERAATAEEAANEHLSMWLGRFKARRGNQRKTKSL
jgi:hypothetical protein